MLYAGIDGGQSSTVAVIGDATRELGRGVGPPADLIGEPRDSQRQRVAIDTAVRHALAAAQLPRDTRFFAAVAGISGFDEGVSPMPDLSGFADNVRVVHDTIVAHAGALGGEPGIVVIAGTGSVALGNDAARPDRFVRAGGWGYFFGDEGSALWIARTALRLAMSREDSGESSVLAERAAVFFGALSLRHIQHAFASGELTRPALAAFARELLALAADGDEDATMVGATAATSLAELCATIDARLPKSAMRRISYAGGLFENAWYDSRFAQEVRRAVSGSIAQAPVTDAAAGALVLARAQS